MLSNNLIKPRPDATTVVVLQLILTPIFILNVDMRYLNTPKRVRKNRTPRYS